MIKIYKPKKGDKIKFAAMPETNWGVLGDRVFPRVEENKLDKALETMGVKVKDSSKRVFTAVDFRQDEHI